MTDYLWWARCTCGWTSGKFHEPLAASQARHAGDAHVSSYFADTGHYCFDECDEPPAPEGDDY